MSKPSRLDSEPPKLGDLRELYRKLKEMDGRLAQLQGEVFMLAAVIKRTDKWWGELQHNMNIIAHSFHGMPRVEEFRRLLESLDQYRQYRDQAQPSHSLRGTGRTRYRRRRGTRRQGGTE